MIQSPPMTDEAAESALEACPFCEGVNMFVERTDLSSCRVVCNYCGACGPSTCDETDQDADASEADRCEPGEMPARRRWNEQALLATIRSLREELARTRKRAGIDHDLLNAMTHRALDAEADVRLWKREAEQRSETAVQFNLDRAAHGVEAMQQRERAQTAEAQRDQLLDALDPNQTKAAYIGEIKFTAVEYDEFGDEHTVHRTLEWTTTKEVMAMIRERGTARTILTQESER